MNLEPNILMAIVIGLIVVSFATAGLFVVISKAMKKRHDAKSLPQGNVKTDFTEQLNRALEEDSTMFEDEDYFA